MELRPDQRRDVDNFLNGAGTDRGGLNASTVGAGKTLTAVQAMHESGSKLNLVVAPLNTFDGWQRTVKAQTDQPLQWISTDNPQALVNFHNKKPGYYFGGWEYMRRYSLEDIPITFAVFDECHRAQQGQEKYRTDNYDLQFYTCREVLARGGHRMLLSATPYGNKPQGAYGAVSALWGHRKDLSYHAFWAFVDRYIGKHRSMYTIEPNRTEYEPGGIAQSMPLYWRHAQGYQCCPFHPEGIQADLPKRVRHTARVKLSAKQRRLYETVKEQMFAWVEDNDYPIQTKGLPILMQLRLRQIALAIPTPTLAQKISTAGTPEEYITMKYSETCTSSKLDALQEIVSDFDSGERVLILTHSAGIIPAIVARCKKAGLNAEGWHGGVNATQRQRIKDSFINGAPNNGGDGSGVRAIVAQIGAIGEGVDGLQWACNNEIWFSMEANNLLNIQAAGRLVRDGQKYAVNSWSIEAEDTIEIDQMYSLTSQTRAMGQSLNLG